MNNTVKVTEVFADDKHVVHDVADFLSGLIFYLIITLALRICSSGTTGLSTFTSVTLH